MDRGDEEAEKDRRGAVLLGLLVAAVHLTNPWETPLALLLAVFALPSRAGSPGVRRLAAAVEPILFASGAGLLAAFPTLLSTRSAAVLFARGEGGAWTLGAVVELYGLPLLVVAVAWVLWGAGGERRERIAFALALAGIALLAFSHLFVVADRMNTLFKFGLQARVLLSLAAGALLPSLVRERAAHGTAWATLVAVLLALGAVTVGAGAAHAAAVLRTRRVPGPRPALDGFACVTVYDPQGAARMDQSNARGGIDPILDTPGPPYGNSLQETMRTGRPTLVGWPWHLQQRRRSPVEVSRREADAARILDGPRDDLRRRLLLEYGIAPSAVVPGGKP